MNNNAPNNPPAPNPDVEAAGAAMLPTDATGRDQDSRGSYGSAPDKATGGSDEVNNDEDLTEALDYVKNAGKDDSAGG